MTSYYYHATQTTVQYIIKACDEAPAGAAPSGTQDIDTTYTPQGRRLSMPGSK